MSDSPERPITPGPDPRGVDITALIPKAAFDDPKRRKHAMALLERAEINPDAVDDELISEMRGAGLKRPEWIEKERWYAGSELEPLENIVCYMAAWGMKTVDIEKSIKAGRAFISETLSSPRGKAEVKAIQERIWGKDPKRWIESILPDAIRTAVELMTDPSQKGSVRLQAAETFMDRALGKAVQRVETNDSSMRKIIEKLDTLEQLRKQGKIDEKEILEAEFSEASPAPELGGSQAPEVAPNVDEDDEADRWIKANYPA